MIYLSTVESHLDKHIYSKCTVRTVCVNPGYCKGYKIVTPPKGFKWLLTAIKIQGFTAHMKRIFQAGLIKPYSIFWQWCLPVGLLNLI